MDGLRRVSKCGPKYSYILPKVSKKAVDSHWYCALWRALMEVGLGGSGREC